MKNIVEYIDGFLKKKNIEWEHNREIFRYADEFCPRSAIDEDFDFSKKRLIELYLGDGESISYKPTLITENLFLIFDEKKSCLKYEFSSEWKNYLSSIAHQKDKKHLEKKFNNFKKDLDADSFDDILE